MDPTEPTGRPMYELLGDPTATLYFIHEEGGVEWERRLIAEIRQAMTDLGVRAAIWYGQRLEDCNAVLGEYFV